MKNFLLFLTLSIIFFSPNFLGAETNEWSTHLKRLDSVSYDQDKAGQIIGLITFTDGSTWAWRRNPLYEDNVHTWIPGDRVILMRHPHGTYPSYTVGLMNCDHQEEHIDFDDLIYVKVTIIPESREYFTKVSEIDMSEEYTITLSDGTRWSVSWFNSFYAQYWKVDDLVIVGRQGIISEAYELINLSQPSKYSTSLINAYYLDN